MKKIIVSILAIAYLGTSTGVMVNMHYCMGKLANWSFGSNVSKTCGNCGMETQNMGCCKDEHKFIKNSSDQKITQPALNQAQLVSTALPVSFVDFFQIQLSGLTKESLKSHDPPLHHGISIYNFTCDYRI